MPNLSFNILTFDHPEPNKDFFFITEKQEGFFPLRNFRLPANVSEILGIDDLEKEVTLYTNFLENVESDLKLTLRLKPELLVYYIRKSRILNERLATLENEISTTNYKKVLYKNRVYSYQKGLPDYVLDDMEAAFPMVNYDLINTLELESGF